MDQRREKEQVHFGRVMAIVVSFGGDHMKCDVARLAAPKAVTGGTLDDAALNALAMRGKPIYFGIGFPDGKKNRRGKMFPKSKIGAALRVVE